MARRAIKQKIVYRYRDRPRAPAQIEVSGSGPINVGSGVSKVASKLKDFQQILITLGSVAAATWLFLGPFVDAKAEELLVGKLVQIGMDPANIQQLNKNLEELQKLSEERAQAVDQLKGDIGKILTIIEQQRLQPPPMYYPPIQMQAAPPPVPVQ